MFMLKQLEVFNRICALKVAKIKEVLLTDVLYVPDLGAKLFSVKRVTEKSFTVTFSERVCKIQKDGCTLAYGKLDNKIYSLELGNKTTENVEVDNVSFRESESEKVWSHKRTKFKKGCTRRTS